MEYRVHTAAVGMQRAITFKVECGIIITLQLPGGTSAINRTTLGNGDIPAGGFEAGLSRVRRCAVANEIARDFLYRIGGLEGGRVHRDGALQVQGAAVGNLAAQRGVAVQCQGYTAVHRSGAVQLSILPARGIEVAAHCGVTGGLHRAAPGRTHTHAAAQAQLRAGYLVSTVAAQFNRTARLN